MRLSLRCVMVAVLCATAHAQPSPQADAAAACDARQTAIEQAMAEARARGQLLRRRELGETLAQVQRECDAIGGSQGELGARILQQEETVERLRRELRRAEEELRRLRQAARP